MANSKREAVAVVHQFDRFGGLDDFLTQRFVHGLTCDIVYVAESSSPTSVSQLLEFLRVFQCDHVPPIPAAMIRNSRAPSNAAHHHATLELASLTIDGLVDSSGPRR